MFLVRKTMMQSLDMTDVWMGACLYPSDGSVLSAYAVMFWDAAGKTVSSTATFCDKEALGILGFTFCTDSKM